MEATEPPARFSDVWGSSCNDVFAVGGDGLILHYVNSEAPTSTATPTPTVTLGVTATGTPTATASPTVTPWPERRLYLPLVLQ